VLTASPHGEAPMAAVDVVFGPREDVDGAEYLWWQLGVSVADGEGKPQTQVVVRGLTAGNPLEPGGEKTSFARYLVRIPHTGETLEYRDPHSQQALLPCWRDFRRHFIPRRAPGSRSRRGMPESCNFLGHVLTLRWAGYGVAWEPWEDVRVLTPDRELLVGTGRGFKDREGRRLPQEPERRNYDYVPFTADDYRVMIRAGVNLFTVRPAQEPFVRGESVFYHRPAEGEPALRYPADLYRSSYLGPTMFMDEPTIIMIGDELIHKSLRYFSDAAALIRARVEARYHDSGNYGAYRLEASLQRRGVEFGAMRLMQWDYPSWETVFETAHYQMQGGLAGIVHEGRYQLQPFDEAVARRVPKRRHTAEEMLRYHFALLRGGTRPLGKHWGTSIYGQCDPQIAGQAVTLAYDMGARYVWFWTSDHDHHLPWPEQLELARRLQVHARKHPRKSIYAPTPTRDKAIVIPSPYFPSLRNLWWVRELDPDGKNEAARAYHRLMGRVLTAYREALDAGEDFDILIDTGKEITGYRKIVRVDARP